MGQAQKQQQQQQFANNKAALQYIQAQLPRIHTLQQAFQSLHAIHLFENSMERYVQALHHFQVHKRTTNICNIIIDVQQECVSFDLQAPHLVLPLSDAYQFVLQSVQFACNSNCSNSYHNWYTTTRLFGTLHSQHCTYHDVQLKIAKYEHVAMVKRIKKQVMSVPFHVQGIQSLSDLIQQLPIPLYNTFTNIHHSIHTVKQDLHGTVYGRKLYVELKPKQMQCLLLATNLQLEQDMLVSAYGRVFAVSQLQCQGKDQLIISSAKHKNCNLYCNFQQVDFVVHFDEPHSMIYYYHVYFAGAPIPALAQYMHGAAKLHYRKFAYSVQVFQLEFIPSPSSLFKWHSCVQYKHLASAERLGKDDYCMLALHIPQQDYYELIVASMPYLVKQTSDNSSQMAVVEHNRGTQYPKNIYSTYLQHLQPHTVHVPVQQLLQIRCTYYSIEYLHDRGIILRYNNDAHWLHFDFRGTIKWWLKQQQQQQQLLYSHVFAASAARDHIMQQALLQQATSKHAYTKVQFEFG